MIQKKGPHNSQQPNQTSKYREEFQNLYSKLNPEQKDAVDSIEGPVLVIAGPGTGKTQVLTMRIANILQKTDTPSSAILALTFTDSGVKAMRERLLSIIGPEAYYVNIYTFHSFCSDILRSNPDKFVITEDFEPLSDLERVQIFREILDGGDFESIKPFGNRYYYVKALIKTIQDLKREGISPENFAIFLKDIKIDEKELQKLLEADQVYEIYQKTIHAKNRYDFEDMIDLVKKSFETDPDFLRIYQERYLYLLVDEYQDTNSSQNKVVNLLSSYWGEEANIFAVGDDAQSIYRFQGASLENILFFTKAFPQAKIVSLKENYRSQKTIIDASLEVLSNNLLKLSDFMEGVTKSQKPVVTYPEELIKVGHFSSGITESFFVANRVKELIKNGVEPREVAVIYRNNSDSKDFSDMFSRMDIAYNLIGGENVLEDHDINKLLKLLEVILKIRNKTEDLDLFTLLNYEYLDFDYVDTLKLSRFATERKLNFVEAINHADFSKTSGAKDPNKFKEFLNKLVYWHALDSNSTFVSFFEKVIEESGFLDWVLRSPNSIEKLNRLNSLFAEIKRLNIANHSLNLEGFMQNIQILRESNIAINEEDLSIRSNAVLLTTAHRSKGLEFEYVFIVKCFDGKWGNGKQRDLIKLPQGLVGLALDDKESKETLMDVQNRLLERNEDERRLFYVAATRAKKELYLTYSDSYLTENSTREAIPSMFVSEIGSQKKDLIDISRYESSVQEILKDIIKPVSRAGASVEERDFLHSVLKNFSLSVTALNTYLECPYKFKLNNLLRTPRAKDKYLALGTAVHAALDRFYRKFREMDDVPSLQYLIDEFVQAIEDEILTESDFKDSKKKGEVILKAYYHMYRSEFAKPLITEKFFGYGNSKIYLDDIPLTGKIDKLELVDVQNKLVKVTDFKTGRAKTRNEIEGKTKYSDLGYKRQLVFYKLLTDLDRSFNFKVVEVELDFIEPNTAGKFVKESFEISETELDELKAVIKDVTKKIRSLMFERTTNYKVCAMCEYKAHCWPDGTPSQDSQQLKFADI